MLATIAEMDSMIAATLQLARDEAVTEAPRSADIAALVQSVVDDLSDAGLPVILKPTGPVVSTCRPDALRRAIRNVTDNAVKYGRKADVAIKTTPKAIEITIDDEGPSLPEQELSRVFQPFYRTEGSRNRETGGMGLGLAIALAIVQAHRGELTLCNRPTGGLRASIVLPR